MGAREDFMIVRRAAQYLGTIAQGVPSDPVSCAQKIMTAASAREVDFIRLHNTPVYGPVIDYAYAILDEKREDSPAADWTPGEMQ